ncbi:hypothetical protein CCMSSC00406_0009710 [Pleurotus cornucopiae]|uniref:Uncharacterized protein n=1 Tax=Pleurotus cornucopiae TaxID=5321 RepID=A0ACB7J877_PLECO|nr:hypothetical protein CCMSSC00406_0009710 [Pleurotus cornucopiae]
MNDSCVNNLLISHGSLRSATRAGASLLSIPVLCMSQLPNELLQVIVAYSERKTLLNLTVISKRINAMALPILYRDITFHIKDKLSISLLRRDIQANRGIQYTKAFAIYFFPCYFEGYDEVRADVDCIIPYLVNVKRLCLTRQSASPGVLSRLPASAQLTDLILDHTHCSKDLPRFLSCNPTLEAIAIHNSDNDLRVIELAASNLPKLRTLEFAFNELVHIKGPMPSVANLSVHPFPCSLRTTGHVVLNFPSICSLSLPHVDLPVVFSLAPSLPNLEFLRVSFGNSNVRPNASDFAVFPKLSYVKFVLHRFSDEGLALELFHAVQSLVIMEVCNHFKNLRWVKSSAAPEEGGDTINDSKPIWGEWWVKRARERIEEALSDPGVLSRLPATAQLTDLILDHTHCSEDLPQFLSCNPTLEAIAIHNIQEDGPAIELTTSNLTKLRSLEITFNELVHIRSPMPSVVDLTVLRFPWNGRATGHVVPNLPSICSLSLPHTDLPEVFSLAQFLPNLELLRLSFSNSDVRPNASSFAVFSKLKCMKFGLYRFSEDALPLELFSAVRSLVVMEISHYSKNLRWIRGSATPLEGSTLNGGRPIWGEWWVERAREYIEEALIPMSQLPNELLQAIVAHLERKTLFAMALPILYRDITFHLEDHLPISLLRRDIQTNAGIQYTKAFAIYFFPCYFNGYGGIRTDIGYIIPYLINVRRLCLTRQCATHGVLSLLPTSSQLTHLILDHTHCSEDLSQFLSRTPTLEAIAIHNSEVHDYIIELAASNLPRLYSLELTFNESIHIQSPMSSVVNLGMLGLGSVGTSDILSKFPSLRSLSLPVNDFVTVLALAPFLRNLEFLEVFSMHQHSRPTASNFAAFSRLKYVKFGMLVTMDAFPLELFDAVPSLVIVDMSNPCITLRWFKGSLTPLKHDPIANDTYLWDGWWELAEELTEEASRKNISKVVLE